MKKPREPGEIHGVLALVDGTGVLIRGESGVGKSECILDLVDRGYRMVADDLIEVEHRDGGLVGRPPEMLAGLLEIRGLGIIDLKMIHGPEVLAPESPIDLVVELRKDIDPESTDRLGTDPRRCEVMGVELPCYHVPVTAGCRPAILVEMAVELLGHWREGRSAGRELQEELRRRIAKGEG